MTQKLKLEDFRRSDYESRVELQLTSIDYKDPEQLRSLISQIGEIDDVLVRLYTLEKIDPECKYVNDTVLDIFGHVIKDYGNVKYKLCDAQACIKRLLVNNLGDDVTLDVFVGNMCYMNFDKGEVNFAIEVFTFSQVFKYFKATMSDFLDDIFVKDKIMLLLIMLDDDEAAISILSDIFEKLKSHIENQIIDEYFFCYVLVVQAAISYDAEILRDYPDYVASLLSFLCTELISTNNIKYASAIDLTQFSETIGTLLGNISKNENTRQTILDIYQQVYERLLGYLHKKTTVYEEVIMMTMLLEILYQVFTTTNESETHNFDIAEIQELIEDFEIRRPHGITENDYSMLCTNFVTVKYKILDFIVGSTDHFVLQLDLFAKDFSLISDYHSFLTHLNNLWKHLEWDTIIHIACKKDNIEDFADAICNEVSMRSKNHLHYIYMYIHSLHKNEQHSLVLLVITKVVKFYESNSIEKDQVGFFIMMYLMDIKDKTNICNIKKRTILLNFIYHNIPENFADHMLAEIINEIFAHRTKKLDNDILLIILLTARKSKDIQESTLNMTFEYIIRQLTSNYVRLDKPAEDVIMHIAAMVLILNFHDKDISYSATDYDMTSETFIKIIIGLLCCIFESPHEAHMLKVKKISLNFLFSANAEQKNLIGSLLMEVDPDIRRLSANDDGLADRCKILIDKINILQ